MSLSVGRHLNAMSKSGLLAENTAPNKQSDQSQPLPHYWIASSHNTYLIEDQIAGKADVCGYTLFLQTFKGGCVEIDPGKIEQRSDTKQMDVTVTHLGTLTGKIYLSDVLRAMKQFATSGRALGPIILSFDNKKLKSTSEQQLIWQLLDKHINFSPQNKQCALIDANACSWFVDPTSIQPENFLSLSPQQLAGKIIVKWAECRTTDAKGKCVEPDAKKGLIARSQDNERFVHMPKSTDYALHSKFDEKKLADSFWLVRSVHKPFDYNSIDAGIVRNTQSNFVRVYPNPMELSKVKSGNYAQCGSWLHGVQMVALNTQKQDANWNINFEMFQDAPYVLKPQWMRRDNAKIVVPAQHTLTLRFDNSDAKMAVHHPNGKVVKRTDGQVTFENVHKDACVIYA